MADLPNYDTALNQALKACSLCLAERIALAQTVGRVLKQDITAERDQPPFDRSAMDGFALAAGSWSPGKVYRIKASVPAGGTLDPTLRLDPAADVVRIATGAAVPEGLFDAVVQIEKAVVDEDAGTVRFEIDELRPGAAVHPRGADAKAGQVVIEAGTRLRPHHLGIAAAAGAAAFTVTRRPRVVVLSSGDEVKPLDLAVSELLPQQIRNSNGPMLVAMLGAMGGDVLRHEHVVDEADAVAEACARAAAEADLVVTAGGVSVGNRDLFPTIWLTLGYETVLHGVAMQPGKPVFLAQPTGGRGAVVVGLPGNPASVLATGHLFVWPMVRKMMGGGAHRAAETSESGAGLPWRRVWLAEDAKPNRRRESFRVAQLVGETREQVRVLAWQGSGDLMHTAPGDGLVRLPASDEVVPAGSGLSFLPLLGSEG